MAASEKTYIIPLRRGVMKSREYRRAKKAVSVIKDFVKKHSKSSDVKIGKHLNLKLWKQGIKNVPCRVKVNVSKDDKNSVIVELFGAPKEVKKESVKKGKEKKATEARDAGQVKEAVVTVETPAVKKEASSEDMIADTAKASEGDNKKAAAQQ